MRLLPALLIIAFAAGCGGVAQPSRTLTLSDALLGTPEALEMDVTTSRRDLFRELSRVSTQQAGTVAGQGVLFPIEHDNAFVAAPGLEATVDLVSVANASAASDLIIDSKADRWSDGRRPSLGGLSEREAAELLSRALIQSWGLHPTGPVRLERSQGAPWAAAWLGGILRLNPAFVSLAMSSATDR